MIYIAAGRNHVISESPCDKLPGKKEFDGDLAVVNNISCKMSVRRR